MSLGRLAVLGFCFSFGSVAQQTSSRPAAPPISAVPTIQIVEGDGAINSIRLHHGHDPVVRIVAADGQPIEGATVTFLLPSTGASGTFAGNEGLSLTVQTDQRGIAVGRGLRPNAVPGQFRIRVNTAWAGSPAAISLTQTNAEPLAHSHTKTIVIIVAIAAAGAAGAAVAASGHGSSNQSNPATTVSSGSIISGTPTIGPPH